MAFDWIFCCLCIPKALFSITVIFIVRMLVFQRTQDEGSVFSEFYAEVIGNYLSTADDILFHIYVITLRRQTSKSNDRKQLSRKP